ncbi:MAG TPA: hypothetical protein DEA62_00540, partial [Coxiellaceae bacterium]|nr:hypothetical protein [Coxiellaceae bacterium]
MRIWLLKDGELLPTDGKDVRLLRMGLLANELSRRGHQVIWWTSTLNHFKKEFRVACDKDMRVDSNYLVKLLHGPGYQKNISFQRIFHNRVIAKRFLQAAQEEERPDIVLASLPTIEFALAATQYGKQYNVPVILDLRDMWPDIFVDIMPKFLRIFARIALEWQFHAMYDACKNATALFGISQGFLNWGLQYAARERGLFDAVYPLAYPDTLLDRSVVDELSQFWRQQGIYKNKNDFILVYAGSLVSSHRINSVIETVKFLGNDVKLVIAGQGPLLAEYQR